MPSVMAGVEVHRLLSHLQMQLATKPLTTPNGQWKGFVGQFVC